MGTNTLITLSFPLRSNYYSEKIAQFLLFVLWKLHNVVESI